MSIALAALISRLQQAVPPRDDIPTANQYELAVKDAALDLSSRLALRKRAEIQVVSGTATYDLPADFLSLIRLETNLTGEGDTLITDQGLVPLPLDLSEDFTTGGQQITFYPTPGYSATRYAWYRAA